MCELLGLLLWRGSSLLVPFIYYSILYFRVGSAWIINSHPVSFCLTLALRFEFTSGWDPTKVPFQFFFLCALSTKMDKIHVYVFRRSFNKVCSCFPFRHMSRLPVRGLLRPAPLPPLHLHGVHQVHPPGVPPPVAEVLKEGVLRAVQPQVLLHAK